MKTKIDIVNDCFTQLRISGITVDPDSDDVELALDRLEDMMSEFPSNINYNFEDTPDPSAITGFARYANYPIAMALALRVAPAYGKVSDLFQSSASSAISQLFGRIARPSRVSYPSRMPIGLGNRRSYPGYYFYPEVQNAPKSPETETVNIGDKKTFVIDFTDYIADGASIQSYTETHDDGLIISSQSFAANAITITVMASYHGWQQIVFTVTSTDGSIMVKSFNLSVDSGGVIGAQ